jgi:hypothetical protein
MPIIANDNWQDSAERDEIAQSGLAPEDEREAVIARTLPPGHLHGHNARQSRQQRHRPASNSMIAAKPVTRSSRTSARAVGSELTTTSSSAASCRHAKPGDTRAGAGNRAIAEIALGCRARRSELEIFDRDGSPIGFNDNWKDSDRRTDIESTGIAPSEDAESAVLLDVSPAPYTAIVRGRERTSGIGLVEVYNVNRLPFGAGGDGAGDGAMRSATRAACGA